MVPVDLNLPKLPDEAPMTQGEFLAASVEDSAAYRDVALRLVSLQGWVKDQLEMMRAADVGH
jgi:hypothetical protein